ncbi:3'-5' exonuclease [Nitzschia inconspicua]|uniref:3'-5' exonuclease n=1 Tax=Nitzschia inconspicua TaxID=303405 RepID=A0A9K3LKA1_9STRA|nr:3'-5' exonuclease [Nitzschia inconspicua]
MPGSDISEALLLQLNRSAEVPPALLNFLTKENHVFVGVRVTNDINQLFKDYNIEPKLKENKVRTEELGRWAKRRGIVVNAGCSLDHLSQTILGRAMDKAPAVRCSKWSSANLTPEQVKYAAGDVTTGLDIFIKMMNMPDLSQRLNHELASTPGTLVDLVPPHARGNCDKIQRGYGHDHDLMTRAAIGEIVEAEMKKAFNDGTDRRANLGDFGNVPFELIVPCTMLREHKETSSIRIYGGISTVEFHMTTRGTRTRPSRDRVQDLGEEADQELYDDTMISDLLDEVLGNENDQAVRDEPAEVSAQEEQPNEVLESDAREENLARVLEAIREAEVAWSRVQFEKGFALLYSPELGDVPIQVQDKFSCVIGDIFHAIDRAKIPVRHEFKKAFKVSMSRAFLEYEPAKLEKVKGKLMERGWTDEEISATMFYNPTFFNRRVERIALPPRQLYYRVQAVMVAFGKRVDSKTKQPLFNKEAWKKAKNLLDEILEGFYSDPPGFDFYTFELDKNGQVKKDSHGIVLLLSCRGTSHVESVHRQYNTMFRHMSGLEMGDALFRERRHRNNIDVARRRYLNIPKFGHYDTWLIDLLQKLIEQNTGRLLFPNWQNVTDFQDTEESFVTVPLHSQGLQNKLDETVAAMKAADSLQQDHVPS